MEENNTPRLKSNKVFDIRISDCSTSVEEDESPQKKPRNSDLLASPFSIDSPTTPRSELFCYPENSPNYMQFNKNLKEFYDFLESTLETTQKEDTKNTVQVKNTAGSSLLMRRLNRISE